MSEDFRPNNRSSVQRALSDFTDASDTAVEGHRDQLDSIRKGDSEFEGVGIPRPIDWPSEALAFANRVVEDTKRFATIWWQMVKALASDEEVLHARPGAHHQRTITLRSAPRTPVHLKPTRLRRLGQGPKPADSPHRVVCDPEVLQAGSDGRFKVLVDVGGMAPGIYIGRIQTDSDDEPEIEYSIYVSEVDAEAAPPS